ncbi:potassium channel family protein [Hansschlegelia zhihuaiae]|uniref:Ion transporter n=1 Tax=Hansschlegelia zhihuaiae TaxID=405005 RepID=A0A4Q0MNR7_9HYPH|nr:potassium channel family protein [Hansschlegelia zhihuaiae]RXF75468.1 ion transporter [Hansschlegelia zhihuaiae]
MTELRQTLRRLYHGRSSAARRFQLAVIVIDLGIIAFFIASPLIVDDPLYLWLDYAIASVIALELVARALASHDARAWARQPTTLVDMFVLATMLAPLWLANLGFLRVLRIWTLSKSDLIWAPLRRRGYRDWEDPARAVVNLVTFLFVTTGFVYTFFRGAEGVSSYVDALYFTVAAVTTTGFGDVTLPGTAGKLTSIVAMIVGISLFVRLAQAIFRPHKVTYRCPQCALMRHDPDAVHCKACGEMLKIPDGDEE